MNIKEVTDFCQIERKRLRESFPIPDKQKEVFARMTKIMEELGELCEAVLSYFSLQRKDKAVLTKDDIEKEVADTIIGLFLLGTQLDLDIEKALRSKMEIIRARKY